MALPAIVAAALGDLAEIAATLRSSASEPARKLAAAIDELIAQVNSGDDIADLPGIVAGLSAAAALIGNDTEADIDLDDDAEDVDVVEPDTDAAVVTIDDATVAAIGAAVDDDYDYDDDYDDEPIEVSVTVTTVDTELTDALADDIVANLGQLFAATTGVDAADGDIVEDRASRDLGQGIKLTLTDLGAFGMPGDEIAFGALDTDAHGTVTISVRRDLIDVELDGERAPRSILDQAVAAAAGLMDDVDEGLLALPDADQFRLLLRADAEEITVEQINVIADKLAGSLAMFGTVEPAGPAEIDGNAATLHYRVIEHAPGRPALSLHAGMAGRGGDTVDGVNITFHLAGAAGAYV